MLLTTYRCFALNLISHLMEMDGPAFSCWREKAFLLRLLKVALNFSYTSISLTVLSFVEVMTAINSNKRYHYVSLHRKCVDICPVNGVCCEFFHQFYGVLVTHCSPGAQAELNVWRMCWTFTFKYNNADISVEAQWDFINTTLSWSAPRRKHFEVSVRVAKFNEKVSCFVPFLSTDARFSLYNFAGAPSWEIAFGVLSSICTAVRWPGFGCENKWFWKHKACFIVLLIK